MFYLKKAKELYRQPSDLPENCKIREIFQPTKKLFLKKIGGKFVSNKFNESLAKLQGKRHWKISEQSILIIFHYNDKSSK